METGGTNSVFGIEQMELSMILVGAVLVTAFSWVATDATGAMRFASAGMTGIVALVVAAVCVRQLN